MVDPLGVVGAILTVVRLIGSAAATASQNKEKCQELAERARNLAGILPNLAHAARDAATARVLERLRVAVAEALSLIQSCQFGSVFSRYSKTKAAELDSVDRRINNCIMDLTLISQARATHAATTSTVKRATAASPPPAPAHPRVHIHHHYRVQRGAASTAHVGRAAPPPPPRPAWGPPPPSPRPAWGAPPGYYQQPPGYAQRVPSPAPYGPYFYAAPSSPFRF